MAFDRAASDLVDDDTKGLQDVFVRDRVNHTTVRVSVDSNGVEANESPGDPVISGDGRYVVFWSRASNLVPGVENSAGDVFLHDRVTGRTVRVSLDEAGKELPYESVKPDVSSSRSTSRPWSLVSSAMRLLARLWKTARLPSPDTTGAVEFPLAPEEDDEPFGSWMRCARDQVATGLVTDFFRQSADFPGGGARGR